MPRTPRPRRAAPPPRPGGPADLGTDGPTLPAEPVHGHIPDAEEHPEVSPAHEQSGVRDDAGGTAPSADPETRPGTTDSSATGAEAAAPVSRRSGRAWEETPAASEAGTESAAPVQLPAAPRRWWDRSAPRLEAWLRRLPGRSAHPGTLRSRALVERLARAVARTCPGTDLSGLSIYVAGGRVMLEGTVASEALRQRVVETVRQTRGVTVVDPSGLQVGLP